MSQEFKQHIEKILPLAQEEFEFIFSHFTVKKLKKHQFLVQEGELVPNDFSVGKGLLKAYHTDFNRKQHIRQFAMQDW